MRRNNGRKGGRSEEERIMAQIDAELQRKYPHIAYEGGVKDYEDSADYLSAVTLDFTKRASD